MEPFSDFSRKPRRASQPRDWQSPRPAIPCVVPTGRRNSGRPHGSNSRDHGGAALRPCRSALRSHMRHLYWRHPRARTRARTPGFVSPPFDDRPARKNFRPIPIANTDFVVSSETRDKRTSRGSHQILRPEDVRRCIPPRRNSGSRCLGRMCRHVQNTTLPGLQDRLPAKSCGCLACHCSRSCLFPDFPRS